MPRLLIVYASQEGQTETIAARIGAEAARHGCQAELRQADAPAVETDPEAYDGVIAGASIHGGRHPGIMHDYLARHAETLGRRPSAFFSVSLSAASQKETERAEARRLAEAFVGATGWHPEEVATFAGALKYSRYNTLLRWIMRRIAQAEGGGTDTSRDYEYTDWDAVREFARSFCARLADGGSSAT